MPILIKAAVTAMVLGLCAWSSAQLKIDLDWRATMGHNPSYGRAEQFFSGPSPMTAKIYGVDLSKWNGTVNYTSLSSAASFAVIRASYGATGLDNLYTQNRSGAEQRGMEIGFYHYAYPQLNAATTEANHFADVVGHLEQGQFAVLDFEESYSGDVVGWCKTWLDTVQARFGVKPLLYINLSANNSYNWAGVVNSDYGLWLARWDYDANAAAPATDWPFVAMRQYSDRETVSGVSGPVDADVFYGSLDQLRQYGYKALVSGQVTLQNYSSGAVAGTPVTVELRPAGSSSAVDSQTLLLDASGHFSLRTAAPDGSYDIAVKGPHWLRQKVGSRSLTYLGISNLAFTLVNGDVNGDNAVSLADFTALRAAFGSSSGDPNWNSNADLNGSGSVSLADFTILRGAFGLSGDN